jgi:CubicO group peptidase (beta-lactamase class C family)
MRRVVTFLTATVLLLGSLAIGVFTADLPFWRRACQLPLPPDGAYLPVAVIGNAEPAALPPAEAGTMASFDPEALERVATHARDSGARALLVMYRGRLVVERYFAADDARSLVPAGLIARPIAAMAVGRALADGALESLQTPVRGLLGEWDGEPRGKITLRQLLEETSGLETGGDITRLHSRSPWDDLAHLPDFATSRGVRLLLGNDFESTALGFPLEHEVGAFYNFSPANTQLAAVIVERATRLPYERYVDEKLWRPLGAGHAELQLDRRSGMPAAHCCWRATARDVLRVAYLLVTDGVAAGHAVLPPGWVRQMALPTRINAGTGMQLAHGSVAGTEILSAADDSGSAFWALPERELAIVSIAGPGGGPVPELPTLVLAALRRN